MIDELAMDRGFLLSHKDFRIELEKHQELSRTATQESSSLGLQITAKQQQNFIQQLIF